MNLSGVQRAVPLKPFTTLKVGGAAEWFSLARTSQALREVAQYAQQSGCELTTLGWGSNVLVSDLGLPGLVLVNGARRVEFADARGTITWGTERFQSTPESLICDSGVGFQDLFLMAAQRNLAGLEFAVGIPGSLGGALVSNAGAYRSNISRFVRRIEITIQGETSWQSPEWMKFAYRDSVLRCQNPLRAVINRVELKLEPGDGKGIYDRARDFQRQRIGKQPPSASAGSFFKNVVNAELAKSIEGLTPGMREAGVIPSGFLIEACGLKGFRLGGAMIGSRHANFLLNVRDATAAEIRSIAIHARRTVFDRFGIELEEEVMYLGDWSDFEPIAP